nr:hypothetical protein [Tanacetum cinerariifolium]
AMEMKVAASDGGDSNHGGVGCGVEAVRGGNVDVVMMRGGDDDKEVVVAKMKMAVVASSDGGDSSHGGVTCDVEAVGGGGGDVDVVMMVLG